MGTSSAWTPERRAKASERMRREKPWEQSTGPRSAEGKAVSSRNANKGGHRPRHREQMRLRREMDQAAHEMIALMRAAYVDGNLRSACIDPDYDRSEPFLAAQARRDRASTEYWRLTWRTDDPDWRLPGEDDE
jgi:hypothetical protein